ncbi:hypothetical protein [Halococcus salsus]|uniref:hypothetical protein n=1 Tax=Halococcus salsus TaxID=2162894 RepID=UPI001359B7E6|nr:hypothetical protein [Halococcus salsus]
MTGPRFRNTTSDTSRRWRRVAGVLALAVLLAFAGCNGILGTEQQNSTTSGSTVTAAAVPTDQPTASPAEQLAPGLTSAGVTSANELTNAQAAFLEDHSTVTRTNTTVTAANGTVLFSLRETIRAGSSDEVVALSANYSGSVSGDRNVTRLDGWTGEQGTYVRRIYENGTTIYSRSPSGGLTAGGALGPTELAAYLSDAEQGNASVVTRETNGSPRYLVSGSFSASSLDSNYRLAIDEQGITRDLLSVRQNPTGTGEEIRSHATLESTGNESLEAPAWLSEARQRTRITASSMATTGTETTHPEPSESSIRPTGGTSEANTTIATDDPTEATTV